VTPRNGSGNGRPAKPGANKRRLTQAESIRRQQEIVKLRDVERRTFGEIAGLVGMAEKETREAYHRYVRELAPLLSAPSADEQIAEALRALDDAGQLLWRLAADADNSSASVGALRGLIDLTFREIQLRQNLGLLPRPLSRITREADDAWLARKIASVFRKYEVPEAAVKEIEQLLDPEGRSDGERQA
jgi:uncharacterized membrane protein YccC